MKKEKNVLNVYYYYYLFIDYLSLSHGKLVIRTDDTGIRDEQYQ